MRRQIEYSGADPVDSEQWFRVAPSSLPVRFQADLAGARAAVRADVSLNRDHVVINRSVGGGVPITIEQPVSAFQGIAVRIEPHRQAGTIRVELELHHADPALRIPLSVTDQVQDVASDWQSWSRLLGLPLLIVEPDGRVTQASRRLGSLEISDCQPRRRRSVLGHRRPRFLMRRKTGGSFGPKLAQREIIARR